MKQINLTSPWSRWGSDKSGKPQVWGMLYVTADVAILSREVGHTSGFVVDWDGNRFFEVCCACDECISDDQRHEAVEVCRSNEVKKLITTDTFRYKEGEVELVNFHDDQSIPYPFERLPDVDVHKKQFTGKKELVLWLLHQPRILFEMKSVRQYGFSHSLNFVEGVNRKGLQRWLEELKKINPNFDSEKFLQYLKVRTPKGQCERDLDVPKIIDDLL